eukprot:scaffold114516_cov70-Phaeocystis_antarctica.AAC.1
MPFDEKSGSCDGSPQPLTLESIARTSTRLDAAEAVGQEAGAGGRMLGSRRLARGWQEMAGVQRPHAHA